MIAGVEQLGGVIKVAAMVALAIIVVAALLIYHKQIAAAIQQFLDNLRRWLTRDAQEQESQLAVSETPAIPPRPFSSFDDPFRSGLAQKVSMNELVAYSFSALEAWAFDAGVPRDQSQTPLEFARTLGERHPEVKPILSSFTELVTLVAYAPGQAPDSGLETLKRFWQSLRSTGPSPARA